MKLRPFALPIAALLGAAIVGCSKPSAEDEGSSGESAQCQGTGAERAPARLLTRLQYDNTVADLLGDATQAARDFPREAKLLEFENSEVHAASDLLVEKYMLAAEGLARRAVEQRLDALAPCAEGAHALECGRQFVRSFGKRAFRRPLEPAEAEIFDRLLAGQLEAQGYAGAVAAVVEAMLQSPQFLYRLDSYAAPTVETGALELDGFVIASRLSYLFWNSMPDARLLELAERGELSTPEAIEAEARRMLEDPRARVTVADFHRQWLGLDRYADVVRDGVSAEEMPLVVRDLRSSLEHFVDHAFWNGGTFEALLLGPEVFVNERLAPLYGAPVSPSGFEPTTLPDGRAGLLMQPGFLALHAYPDQSSLIHRGKELRERFLCDPPDPPPDGANQEAPDPDPNATTRERFRQHTENPVCASCHQLIDPFGFAFENFDQIGRFRSEEYGLAVDATGTVTGFDDPELDGPFTTPDELTARIANSRRARDCLASHWYQYAIGRQQTDADACSLSQLQAAFAESGGDLRELLVAITQTDTFLYRPAEPSGARVEEP